MSHAITHYHPGRITRSRLVAVSYYQQVLALLPDPDYEMPASGLPSTNWEEVEAWARSLSLGRLMVVQNAGCYQFWGTSEELLSIDLFIDMISGPRMIQYAFRSRVELDAMTRWALERLEEYLAGDDLEH